MKKQILSLAILLLTFFLPFLWKGSGLKKINLSLTILFIALFLPFLWKGSGIGAQNIAITDDDTYIADSSAMLDIKSVSKGLLLPRMTTLQRNGIVSPAEGLLVFDTDFNSFFYYSGGVWNNLSSVSLWEQNGPKVHLADSSNNVGVGTSNPQNKFIVKGNSNSSANEAIFAVVSPLGDTLFAVYPDGTRVYVNDSPAKATSSKGGFAVGGFSPSKGGVTNEYLRVTPDSVRIYIEENNGAKATTSKGGFAVGGFSPSKMTVSDYLSVNSDSINVSKSLYLPRLTTFERDNLGFTPSEALIIYNTTDDCMEIYKNGVWSNIWCFHCAATIITQPFSATVCEWQDTSFIVSATGTSLTFQWQLSTDGGTIWNNISDGGISPFYIGSNTFMLSVSNISVGNNGYMFRCNITASCPPEITSSEVLLNVMANPPSITVNPINQALSSSYTASFSISSLGYNVIYQWQQSSDGINWNDISNGGTSPEYNGVTTNVLSLSDVPPSFNNYKFRCIAGNSCGTSAISTDATLSISAPSVSTTAASNIQSTSVTCGGNVLLNGGAAVTACGVCWSTSNDPSLSDSFTTDGSGTGSFVSSITGLTPGVTYYFRAYATNAIGTSYGIVRSFFTPTVDVGQSYQGGIVAYILQVGDPGYFSTVTHGIIVSESDQSSSANWGCYGTLISGADETGIGYGQQNTTDIIADCATAGIAAKICDDLVLNGYSDWYLPSKDELNKLYINKTLIGGFTNNYYWSSSEVTNNNANRQYFLNGTQNNTVKSFSCYVRAIRTF